MPTAAAPSLILYKYSEIQDIMFGVLEQFATKTTYSRKIRSNLAQLIDIKFIAPFLLPTIPLE